jgi:hypothetical protein
MQDLTPFLSGIRTSSHPGDKVGGVKPAPVATIVCCGFLVGTCSAATAAPRSRTPLGSPVVQRTFSGTTVDGYTLRATFRVYRPAHANALPVLPYDHRSSLSCPVDGTADAVVPVAFTLTNTTTHASVGLGTAVAFQVNPVRNISRLKFDAMLGNRLRCITTTAANAAQYTALWNRASKPGQGERADLYVIVPGYYTPAHPDGDRAYLHTLYLDIFLYANGHVPGHNRFRGSVPPHDWLMHLGK